MLSDFKDKSRRTAFHLQWVQNGRETLLKLNIYNSTNNSNNFSNSSRLWRCGCRCFRRGSGSCGRHRFIGWNIAAVIWMNKYEGKNVSYLPSSSNTWCKVQYKYKWSWCHKREFFHNNSQQKQNFNINDFESNQIGGSYRVHFIACDLKSKTSSTWLPGVRVSVKHSYLQKECVNTIILLLTQLRTYWQCSPLCLS